MMDAIRQNAKWELQEAKACFDSAILVKGRGTPVTRMNYPNNYVMRGG